MTIQEFETKLKELDPLFQIIPHPTNTDVSGVYYDPVPANKTGFIITVPSQEIREERDPSFQDETGHVHNWASKVMAVCEQHVDRMRNMPGYRTEFYEPLYQSKKA